MMRMVFITDIPGIENVRIYSYRELRSATEDFSLANKIGEGGFGSVFKVSRHPLDLILLVPPPPPRPPLFFFFWLLFVCGCGWGVGGEGGGGWTGGWDGG